MYKFKDVATRATAFAGAVFMLGGIVSAAVPGIAFADTLNPLTERTLLLTSSSPGFHYLDGSGNTTFAPPGSGPNGKQTGETFSFKVSTNSSASGTNQALKSFTFQYCTTAAGACGSPGDDTGNANTVENDGTTPHTPNRGSDDTGHSDLNVNYGSPVCGTDFEIYVGGVLESCTGWNMAVTNKEDGSVTWSGKNNFITLSNATSAIKPTAGTLLKVVFKASNTNYITNPGSGAFFVKINTFKTDTNNDPTDPADQANIVDGGVTVANVMTDSIQITTKVLETMSFSVGTVNPDTVDPEDATYGGTNGAVHGPCDVIRTNNVIQLGDNNAEYSLSPSTAYDAHSYWRLSSNSSGGATVYYSGTTLRNTVGDYINPIGTTAAISHPGMEQFGLAYDSTADTLHAGMTSAITADQALPADQQQGFKNPTMLPILAADGSGSNGLAATDYSAGAGTINGTYTAKFGFDMASLTSAVPFAGYTADVIQCSTGKMRYLANISPNTPAGVYTTKINYLAAPQY